MRLSALAFLAIATAAIAAPAKAQTFGSSFPVCLQVYGRGAYYDCSFTSLAQCNASASGRSAQCIGNPYFANAELARPYPYRRYRHIY